jgi:hypothetical protein
LPKTTRRIKNKRNQDDNTGAVVRAFARVARRIILRHLNRRSCIASSRITIECLKNFGIESSPVPVRFILRAPDLHMVFVAGISPEEQASARRSARKYIELATGPGGGWNGHVIVKAPGFVIDPSFDQALDAFAEAGCRIDDAPRIAVFPLQGVKLPEDFCATFTATLDDDTKITAQYDALFDTTFADQPAWETEHIQPAIRAIISKMKKVLE